jgi:uncharacterized protein YqgV (UPF0045/DUF77 family)
MEMANSLVSIQMIPKTKNGENVIPYVDKAIEVIANSKVLFRVGPLETTMEGELTEIFQIIQHMQDAMIDMGSVNVISQVKILYQPSGITMNQLTEKYDT